MQSENLHSPDETNRNKFRVVGFHVGYSTSVKPAVFWISQSLCGWLNFLFVITGVFAVPPVNAAAQHVFIKGRDIFKTHTSLGLRRLVLGNLAEMFLLPGGFTGKESQQLKFSSLKLNKFSYTLCFLIAHINIHSAFLQRLKSIITKTIFDHTV